MSTTIVKACGMLIVGCILLLGAGCTDDDPPGTATSTSVSTPSSTSTDEVTRTPTGTATVIPSPTATVSDPNTRRTGIPAVDDVIDAMLGDEAATLIQLVEFTPMPCVPATGVASPLQCPDGVAEGTIVEVLPIAACEGTYGTPEMIAQNFESLMNSEPALHAILGAVSTWSWGPADYVIVFSFHPPAEETYGLGLVVAGDRVVGTWLGCAPLAERITANLIARGAPVILPATESSGQSPEAELEAGKLARQEASPDLSNALCQDITDCPPPPAHSRFINQQGFFELPEWDDRNLTDEEKAQDPWRDPFWPAFVQCLQDAGVGVGVTTPEGATQADINLLVAEVNESGPAYVVSPTGLQFQSTPASDAFLQCETILYNQRPSGVSGPDARR